VTPFSFLTAGRILFGRGQSAEAAAAVEGFGRRVALVRGGSVRWADVLAGDLEERGCVVTQISCRKEPDVPGLSEALAKARAAGVEVVIAVGGGAVIDMGKALAALLPSTSDIMDHLEGVGKALPLTQAPLPFVAVPTTSGTGAEVTKNAVIAVPDAGRKVSLRDDRMLPDLAIVDPVLTDNAPRGVTLASGLDAVTQVIEPYLSTRANALTDSLCITAIPIGLQALARLEQGEDADARDAMAFVSLCGGLALANAGLGAVHGLAGVIGGRLGAPHGLICGRLLGPVLAANRQALREAAQDIARFDQVSAWMGDALALDSVQIGDRLTARLDDWGVARLGQWVRADTNLEEIARESALASSMRANPCTLSVARLVEIIRSAL
jgi:alcohol dehydrogenase class IV